MGFGAILGIILPLLSKLPGTFGEYFKQKQEVELQKLETERQIEIAKQQLASDTAKSQLELSKTMVAATGTYFKYFTFVMWFGPFMIGSVWPAKSKEIFENLAGMPLWYVQSCMIIMFTVWGISVSAPVVANVFSGISQFISDRRVFKLEKARINRAAAFNAVKSKWFKKGMTQPQVDEFNEILDKGEQDV